MPVMRVKVKLTKNNPAMAQNLRQWADATAAFGSEGMKAAATNAPMFVHATEALMSRLPAANGYPPTQIDNTPRPCPMLVARCDYEFWPHESMEMPLRAYAWLARVGDEHRSAVHQDLA